MKIRHVSALCVLLIAAPVHAAKSASPTTAAAVANATLKSENEIIEFADRMMQAIAHGDIDAAYGALKAYSVLPPSEIDAGLQTTKQQRMAPQFAQRFGATIGTEFIGRKKVGQSMLRLDYIEKTQKQPLPWTLYFYLTPAGWVLTEFGWSAQAATLYSDY